MPFQMTKLERTFFTQPESKGVYIFFTIVVLLCASYGFFLWFINGWSFINTNDILNKTYTEDIPVFGKIGGWRISHLITFYIAGLLFPFQWPLIFILGVVWEFIEVTIGSILLETMGGNGGGDDNGGQLYTHQWMDGSLVDLWYNGIGLFLGYWTSMFLKQRREKLYSVEESLII
jgi:hypothetical protein